MLIFTSHVKAFSNSIVISNKKEHFKFVAHIRLKLKYQGTAVGTCIPSGMTETLNAVSRSRLPGTWATPTTNELDYDLFETPAVCSGANPRYQRRGEHGISSHIS